MKMTRPNVIAVTLVLTFLLGCAGGREIRIADQFAKAGNWEGAVFLYQEASKKDPKNMKLREKLTAAKTQAAAQHYQKGKEFLQQKEIPQAIEEFKRAMSLDPAKQEHQDGLNEALRLNEAQNLYVTGLKLMRAERFSEALQQLEQALDLDPSLIAAQEAIQKLTEDQKAGLVTGEAELTLKSTQPITLKFQNAKLNEVFEFLSKTSGINILFDKDVRPETVTVTIFVKNVSFKEALNLIMTTNNLFMKKISEDTILVIPKTKQKVDQYQDLVIRTFYLSNVKADDIVNLVRTMLETRRVFVNKELNALVIRDTPEKIKLAEKIIEANDRMVAEVMFNVEVLEVVQTNKLKYGWSFSSNQIVAGVGKFPGDAAQGIISLETFRGDYTWFFTVPSVIVDFLKTEGEAKTLANPRIRVLDNKQAKVNIGDKVPILLSTTTTAAAAVGTTPTTTFATNIEFRDVGIKLTVKPKVDLTNDVTLEINLEVTSLGDLVDLGNNVRQFRFGNRTAETILNVKNGETVVIGGLIRDDDRVNYNKVPGLGDIPLLGKLFSSTDKTKEKTDIILTITPNVVRGLQTPDRELQYFWSGTEDTYSTKPLFSDLPTTGEVQSEQGPTVIPGETPLLPVPPPATSPLPPSFAPPAPLPPVPGLPTPSTLPRRRSQLDFGLDGGSRVAEAGE